MEELKHKNKSLICVIIVLVCLVLAILITFIRNNKKEQNIINNEPKTDEIKTIVEEPKEELKNESGIIIKQIVRNEEVPTKSNLSEEKKYLSDLDKDYFSYDNYIINNIDEYKEGPLRYENNKIIYDYESLDSTGEKYIIRYEIGQFGSVKTILWNKNPNKNNEIIIYFINEKMNDSFDDSLYKATIKLNSNKINIVLIKKYVGRITTIDCFDSKCDDDSFYILINDGIIYTDYPFDNSDKLYSLFLLDVDDNKKNQIVKKSINGKEHTLKLELKKEIDKYIYTSYMKENGISPYISNVINYDFYFDNTKINDISGFYDNEYNTSEDKYISFNDNSINILKSNDKDYFVIDFNIPYIEENKSNKYIVSDTGKLIGKIEYIFGGWVNKLEGENSELYEENNTFILSDSEIKLLVADERNGESDPAWFTENIITIEDEKLKIKTGGRLLCTEMEGATMSPSWKITTYE